MPANSSTRPKAVANTGKLTKAVTTNGFSFDPQAAVRLISRRDGIMKQVIRAAGPFALKLQRDPLQMLVRSILSQQISTSAARSIREKLECALPGGRVTARALSELSPEDTRACGISNQKHGYIQDLVQRVNSGDVNLRRLSTASDQEIIAKLVQVHGIGVWTAKMFLIFCLGRPDVLPFEDYGVRAAIRNLYGLAELPSRAQVETIAEPWRPFATVASWYCWRSLDLVKNKSQAVTKRDAK
jgi:DNA-3-methyladenine glycosylase II